MNLKRLVGLEFGALLGLDIGSSSVKLVKLQRNGDGVSAVAAGITQIEDYGDDSHVQDLKTVKAISQCFASANIKDKYAVCGVSGPEVAVRYFKFPMLPDEEIPSAIELEAEQVCPFSLGDSALDYQLIPDGSDSIRGVLVAATNKAIRKKGKLVRESMLNPILMDVDGLALLNCLNACHGQEDGTAKAVLNVGSTYTTLVISGEDCVPFVRDTERAATSIIATLAEDLGLERSRVSELLFSEEVSDEDRKCLAGSFESVCENLIEDVTGTLRFYTAQKKSLFIEKIYVCGGFARANGFVDILNSRLPAETILWNPFEKITTDMGSECENLLKKEGPSLAVAAGLAMRTI